ncbi:MAG: hypothetical protein JNJ40_15810 [Bacteroidia bacterium]|nr:hypothetical protein [Bacteroidia bacterium]
MYGLFKLYRDEAKKHGLRTPLNYFFRWKKSLEPGATSVRDEQPWITFQAIDFLNKNLKSTDKVFEYGGGGSTLFFAKRVAEIITVEHNEEWFKILSDTIKQKNIKSWKGNFVLPEKGDLFTPPDFANPDHYSADDVPSYGFNYKAYVSVIDQYPDIYFDCIIIDGRSRPACIKHAMPKLKAGGFLVLDNSDRKYYLTQTEPLLAKDYQKLIGEQGPSPYASVFTRTTIWKKLK